MAKCVCKAAPIIGAVFAGLALALAGAAQADETRASRPQCIIGTQISDILDKT